MKKMNPFEKWGVKFVKRKNVNNLYYTSICCDILCRWLFSVWLWSPHILETINILKLQNPEVSSKQPKWYPWGSQHMSPKVNFSSVQFSSVAQPCLTLCDPMNRSTPGLPVHHQLPSLKLMSIESVVPSSHLILSSPSPPALSLSQHQGFSQWVSSSHQVAKVLELKL